MGDIVREVERPKWREVLGWVGKSPNRISAGKNFFENIQLVGSGKGAVALVLRYLLHKGVLHNKLDEVLVPDWLGYWVYNQIQTYAFPAKRFSERTKALFVYHQYGFPQDMEKIMEFAKAHDLIVIEDCAHALASFYKGRVLGGIGDFAIFSFSKWFFCFALGGVSSKFPEFGDFVKKAVLTTPFGLGLAKDSAKFFYERSTFSSSEIYQKYANFFLNMTYSVYGEALKPGRRAVRLLNKKIDNEIQLRQRRYQNFISSVARLGIVDHLEREGITPYAIPVRYPQASSAKLVEKLAAQGIKTGIYHFDANRNLLSPRFIPCVLVPCHGGISDQKFEEITDLVLKCI